MATQSIQITGSVLSWALQESGLPLAEIADRVKASEEELLAWQQETATPSQGQVTKLGAVLKRPPSLFFLPTPPEISQATAFYRQAIGDRMREPRSEELESIRQARRIQSVIRRVSTRHQGSRRYFLHDSPEKAAILERQMWQLSLEQQFKWQSTSVALREWIGLIESSGVSVLRFSMGRDGIRGFALWDEMAPLLAFNTAYKWTAQRIFTVLHEYAHIRLGESAVITESELSAGPQRPLLNAHRERVEDWCNRFAAATIIPESSLKDFLTPDMMRSVHTDEYFSVVDAISKRFKASLRTSARRLTELGLADLNLYYQVLEVAQPFEFPEEGGFGNPERTRRPFVRIDKLGRYANSALISAIDQELISIIEAAKVLDVGVEEIAEIREDLGLTTNGTE